MDLKKQFKKAQQDALKLPDRPDNKTLLELYSLYKQGTEGDVSGKKPGLFDMVKKAKFEAWEKKKGLSKEDAMKAYVDLVKKLNH